MTALDSELRLLGFEDLLALPELDWLIDGVVPEAGLGVIYAPSGALKSFLALDWALSVGTGTAWLGNEVKRRPVVYLAGEGRGGLKQRVRAWWEAHGRPDMAGAHWLLDPVDLRNEYSVSDAIGALATLPEPPGLVVVDTMARAMPGADENAARDVGEFVKGVDLLRGDGLALVVHHTGKDGSTERGSGALRAAADVMVKLTRRKGLELEVECDYLRDGEEWSPLELKAVPVLDSLTLEMLPRSTPQVRDDLNDRVLSHVREHGPCSQRDVERGVRGRAEKLREALSRLEQANLVEQTDRGWHVRPESPDAPGTHPSGATEEECVREGGLSPKESPPGDAPDADRVLVPGRGPEVGTKEEG